MVSFLERLPWSTLLPENHIDVCNLCGHQKPYCGLSMLFLVVMGIEASVVLEADCKLKTENEKHCCLLCQPLPSFCPSKGKHETWGYRRRVLKIVIKMLKCSSSQLMASDGQGSCIFFKRLATESLTRIQWI